MIRKLNEMESIDPSGLFMDVANFLDELASKVRASKDKGERIPLKGFIFILDGKPSSEGGSPCATTTFAQCGEDMNQIVTGMVKLARQNPDVRAILSMAAIGLLSQICPDIEPYTLDQQS